MRLVPLDLPPRPLGDSGLLVSALGFGAGQIGGPDLTEEEAGTVLNRAVDLGVTFVDTAPGYGLSEERIGRHLSYRRDDFVLASKGGYGVPGVPDWTPASIRQGVDQALRRLRTDHLDVMLLHSCPRGVLDSEGLVEALAEAVRAGKVRVAGYSGEGEALAAALDREELGVIETSVNLLDQHALTTTLPAARARGLGVIAKRPLGNAPWRFSERPVGHYAETYWERLRAMERSSAWAARSLEIVGGDAPAFWASRALRFSAFAEGVTTAIVGTSNPTHVQRNVDIVNLGPLPPDELVYFQAAFATAEDSAGWSGLI
jgi:aryl-alcohol dehydrogenase-like predicted oxidoreductase